MLAGIRIISIIVLVQLIPITQCREKELPEAPPYQVALKKLNPQELEVHLSLAEKHHLYLDEGEAGTYNPLIFRWGQKQENEFTIVQRPEGSYDSELRVHVLRGEGHFIVQHDKMPEIDEIAVRAQICSEQTNICYRPIWTTHSVTPFQP